MRGSQSSATQVDDCWKTSKEGVILPQAMWEVQAIREKDEEKLSGGDENSLQVSLLAPPKYDRCFRNLGEGG
jgi:hypothetical protein